MVFFWCALVDKANNTRYYMLHMLKLEILFQLLEAQCDKVDIFLKVKHSDTFLKLRSTAQDDQLCSFYAEKFST